MIVRLLSSFTNCHWAAPDTSFANLPFLFNIYSEVAKGKLFSVAATYHLLEVSLLSRAKAIVTKVSLSTFKKPAYGSTSAGVNSTISCCISASSPSASRYVFSFT